VRAGSGPPGANEAQADGSALTYAKRYAVCGALSLRVEHDTDARNEGEPISPLQAAGLRRMVYLSGANEKAFLRFAGAATYEEIGSSRFKELCESLEKKMQQAEGPK
jgi:hypothetical protein